MGGLRAPASTRHYTASSCHEVGYRWKITAPAELEVDELKRLQDALVGWSDHPTMQHLNELLQDEVTLEEYGLRSLELLAQVTFEIDPVHRDHWTQDWSS